MPLTLESPTTDTASDRVEDVRLVLAHLNPPSRQARYVLNKPVFGFSDIASAAPDITYRRINFWDEAGLISSHRQTKDTGWRRFSFQELVLLQVIADLQDFRFHSIKIKCIRRNIRRILKHRSPEQAPCLEAAILLAVAGKRIALRISKFNDAVFVVEDSASKRDAQSWLSDAARRQPYLTLPFSDYVERALGQPSIRSKLGSLLTSLSGRG